MGLLAGVMLVTHVLIFSTVVAVSGSSGPSQVCWQGSFLSKSMEAKKGRVSGKQSALAVKQEDEKAQQRQQRRDLSNLLTCMNRDIKNGVEGASRAKEMYGGCKTPEDKRAFLRDFISGSSQGGSKKWQFCLAMDKVREAEVIWD